MRKNPAAGGAGQEVWLVLREEGRNRPVVEVYLKPNHGSVPSEEALGWKATAKLRNKEIWGSPTTLCVATDASPSPASLPVEDGKAEPPAVPLHYKLELLKSALQKAVRRRKTWTAVRVAHQLMEQDIGQFLRRLPVIIMEDAVLPPARLSATGDEEQSWPGLGLVVWLMVAHSKGWNVTRRQRIALLQLVHQAAATPYHDVIPRFEPRELIPTPALLSFFEDEEDSGKSMYRRATLMALLIRASYGGMKGDVEMLRGFACIWAQRWQHYAPQWEFILSEIVYPRALQREIARVKAYFYGSLQGTDESDQEADAAFTAVATGETSKTRGIGALKARDKLPEAVDFHCFPGMIRRIQELHLQRTGRSCEEGQIKSAIWDHRSGWYEKTCMSAEQDPLFPVLYYRHHPERGLQTAGEAEEGTSKEHERKDNTQITRAEELRLGSEWEEQRRISTQAFWDDIKPSVEEVTALPFYWRPQRELAGSKSIGGTNEQQNKTNLKRKRASLVTAPPTSDTAANQDKKKSRQSSLLSFFSNKPQPSPNIG